MGNPKRNAVYDPVCGMTVNPASTPLVSSHNDRSYYFCAEGCRKAFEENPGKYLKKKGVFRRWLDRMAKSNQESFGPKGPTCCN